MTIPCAMVQSPFGSSHQSQKVDVEVVSQRYPDLVQQEKDYPLVN